MLFDYSFSHLRLSQARRCAAFSSVEFMAAVVLSMIMSVIAVAGYRLYEREMPVEHAAKQLAHAFSAARTYAITQNWPRCAVRIDLDHHVFWVDGTEASGVTRQSAAKVIAPERFDPKVVLDYYSGLQRDAEQNIISAYFYPDGHADSTAELVFKLNGAGSETRDFYTVKLYGPTGLAKVFERQRLE